MFSSEDQSHPKEESKLSGKGRGSISCEARATFVSIVLVVAILIVVLLSDPKALLKFLQWAEKHPTVAALIIAFAFFPLSIVMVPLDMALYIAGGYLYGLWLGFAICYAGYNLGSWFGFYAVRFTLREWVDSQMKNLVSYRALSNAVSERGFLLVLLLQMAPIMPYSLISYFFGSSDIHFSTFAYATSIGSVPFVFFFSMMGASMHSIEEAATGKIHHGTAYWILTSIGVLAAIISIALLATAAKNEVTKVIEHDERTEPQVSSPLLLK